MDNLKLAVLSLSPRLTLNHSPIEAHTRGVSFLQKYQLVIEMPEKLSSDAMNTVQSANNIRDQRVAWQRSSHWKLTHQHSPTDQLMVQGSYFLLQYLR